MCDCSWCVCAAILNKIGRAFHGELRRNNPFLFYDYNWCTFIWEFKKCTSQGKKNTGSLLIQPLNILPFFSPSPPQLLSVRKAEKDEEKALMKGSGRMWGVLEEALRLPVSGSLLGGTAWLLLPAGRLSRCLHDSAALTNNTRGWEKAGVRPGKRKGEKMHLHWASASDVRFSTVFFFTAL